MRVLTGQLKGKKLNIPRRFDIRPTTARVKKSVFDMLFPQLPGARVLDLFSGSGNLGIEALSCGAEHCVFVEKNPAATKTIHRNLRDCGYVERSRILNFDFRKALSMLSSAEPKFDIVFADPPYEIYNSTPQGKIASDIADMVEKNGVIVIEHPSGGEIKVEGFIVKVKKYGGTSVSVLRRAD